jgi:predicted glycogen debranching enzyme
MPRTILDDSLISFGRELCGDLDTALSREWLVTNGLGGYASGTVAGVSTRSYHGLLVAALESPLIRVVLVGGSVEQAIYGGRRIPISTNEYADGVFVPNGYRHLAGFRLEGTLPVWTFALADALLERRLWMPYGRNSAYLSYRLLHASGPVDLEITPLIAYRDHHTLTSGQGWQMQVERHPHGVLERPVEDAAPLRLLTDTGEFRSGGRWYWNFRYREEAARGFRDHGDLYAPGSFTKRLEPGEMLTVIYSVENDVDLDGARSLEEEQQRQRALITRAAADDAPAAVQQLVLAADQFLASRPSVDGEDPTPTILAGYHWFGELDRASMISLPGLTLATRRHDEAAQILRSFAAALPDSAGPASADVPLWFVHAVDAYGRATGDDALLDELLPTMTGILDRVLGGSLDGIGVDPADGLLRAARPNVPLTWMNARVDDWVVTPRAGKPVEINALWYNALRVVAAALTNRNDSRGKELLQQADRVRESFHARFVPPAGGYLADVIDGPDGDDWSFRPNQLLALSLPHPLVEGDVARGVLDAVGRALVTTHGLRSLDPDDTDYAGGYTGDRAQRDAVYHQGPVWPWLFGAYADALLNVTGDRARVANLLTPFEHHLRDAGLGSISELFEGAAPHLPRGAIAQAWSVAEILRIHRLLETL